MQHIIDNLLMPTEKVIQAAHIHPIIFFWSGFATLLGLGLVFEEPVLGIVILAFAVVDFTRRSFYFFGTELVLTNERIVSKFGLIIVQVFEIRLERIESINVRQGLFGRFFNYGTFVVNGVGGVYTQVPMVIMPFDFRRKVVTVLENQLGFVEPGPVQPTQTPT